MARAPSAALSPRLPKRVGVDQLDEIRARGPFVDVGGGGHEIEGFSELENPRLMDWSFDGAWLVVRESIGRSELWRVPDLLGER